MSIVFYKITPKKQKRADRYSRLFVKSYSLHHHRLRAAVCEGEHKPSAMVNGDALHNGTESAVLPFGVEEVKLAKLADILGHSSINTTRIYIISTGTEHRQRMENMRLII